MTETVTVTDDRIRNGALVKNRAGVAQVTSKTKLKDGRYEIKWHGIPEPTTHKPHDTLNVIKVYE